VKLKAALTVLFCFHLCFGCTVLTRASTKAERTLKSKWVFSLSTDNNLGRRPPPGDSGSWRADLGCPIPEAHG